MSFSAAIRNGVQVISVRGPLHENLIQVVAESLDKSKHILLDLTEADSLLGRDGPTLVRCQQAALAKGGVFGVAGGGTRVSLLLALLGAERTIPTADGVDEGTEVLKRRSVGKRQETTKTGLDREALAAAAAEETSSSGRLQTFVQLAIHGLDHIKILEHVLATAGAVVEPGKAAKAIGATPSGLTEVMNDLQGVRIFRSVGGGKYQFDPSATARKILSDLLKMWKHPNDRKELIRWVTESHKQLQGRPAPAAAEKKGGLLGKFFGK